MILEYKCPICKAKNKLSRENKKCRRCKEDLTLLYNFKLSQRKNLILNILNKRHNYEII